MINGLSFFGLNGSGKSTLAHALAKQTDYFEMDAEDYYFPEQKESRKWAMDPNGLPVTEPLGTIPFSASRTKEEVQNALINDFRIHPRFILSSVTMNWNEAILSRIDLAFLVQTRWKSGSRGSGYGKKSGLAKGFCPAEICTCSRWSSA